jgi:hypothetical protein
MMNFYQRPSAGKSSARKPLKGYTGVAMIVTFATMADGLASLISGVQWFMAGGSLIPRLDIVETGVGAIISGMSALMISVLFTKLKVFDLASSAYDRNPESQLE